MSETERNRAERGWIEGMEAEGDRERRAGSVGGFQLRSAGLRSSVCGCKYVNGGYYSGACECMPSNLQPGDAG